MPDTRLTPSDKIEQLILEEKAGRNDLSHIQRLIRIEGEVIALELLAHELMRLRTGQVESRSGPLPEELSALERQVEALKERNYVLVERLEQDRDRRDLVALKEIKRRADKGRDPDRTAGAET